MGSEFEKGVKAEEKVARALRGHGASVSRFPGSKGPGAPDLLAEFPDGLTWGVQVKSVGKGPQPSLSPQERARLGRIKETPVIATVAPGGQLDLRYLRNGRPVRFPKKKSGRKRR
jgi:hypothetical protein